MINKMKYTLLVVFLLVSTFVIAQPHPEMKQGCTKIYGYNDCMFNNQCTQRINQLVFESGEGGSLNTRLHDAVITEDSYFYDVTTRKPVVSFGGRWIDEEKGAYVLRSNQYQRVYYVNSIRRDGVCKQEN